MDIRHKYKVVYFINQIMEKIFMNLTLNEVLQTED